MLARLHEIGLSGSATLHRYHCDCITCDFGAYAFHGQTDSSCSGEIISDIFGYGGYNSQVYWPVANERNDGVGKFVDFSSAQQCISKICDIAVEVDAEPGTTSGFHVHIGAAGMDQPTQREMLWQFARWEPVLEALAAGRWGYLRTMNRSVNALLLRFIAQPEDYEDAKREAWHQHKLNDRHSNLNLNTPHNTYEFRIWNSTRVAWRMEMFVEMSIALTDAEVLSYLSGYSPGDYWESLEMLQTAVAGAGYTNLAAHIARQSEYLRTRASTAPAMLTCL